MDTMKQRATKILATLLCALLLAMGVGVLSGCTEQKAPEKGGPGQELINLAPSGVAKGTTVVESGTYTSKDEVALYIHQFGHVPSNYITKTQARKKGWDQESGNLWDVLPGMSIGGGGFYNDDGMMPDAKGREWFEVDIDYNGGYRNAKRIIYSNDGLIYYTDDHYETFERLY